MDHHQDLSTELRLWLKSTAALVLLALIYAAAAAFDVLWRIDRTLARVLVFPIWLYMLTNWHWRRRAYRKF